MPRCRRAVRHGDGWFAMPVPPDVAAPSRDRLRELAADAGRAAPAITGSMAVALDGDPALPRP